MLLGLNVSAPSGTHLKYLLMAKRNSLYVPLPMPPTTKDKYAIYLNVGEDIEMFLYDGKQVFTPDFPDIPIERVDLADGRVIRQETLARICRHLMKYQTVVYNEQFGIWEALANDPF